MIVFDRKSNFWPYKIEMGVRATQLVRYTIEIVYNDIVYNDEPDITTEL